MEIDYKSMDTQELERHIALAQEEYKEREDRRKGAPKIKSDINWNGVIELLEDHVKRIVEEGTPDEDDAHYMYEEVVDAVYGSKAFWDWYNDFLG